MDMLTKCLTGSRIKDAEEEEEGRVSESEERGFVRQLSTGDSRTLELLLRRQARAMPQAIEELREHGRKTTHWSWWAFPTEKPGSAEPHPRTRVTTATAPELLRRAPREWRQVLELIVELIDETGDAAAVLPPIDHGRILFFIKFWQNLDDSPVWLLVVCKRLRAQFASPKAPRSANYRSQKDDQKEEE